MKHNLVVKFDNIRRDIFRFGFVRFGIVGAFGFLVDAGVLYILLFCGLDYFSGRLVSFLLAVMFTWQLNRKFTFIVREQFPLWKEASRYFIVCGLGGIVNIGIYSAVVFLANPSPITPLIGVAVGSIAGMCVNYFSAKNFVFQSR